MVILSASTIEHTYIYTLIIYFTSTNNTINQPFYSLHIGSFRQFLNSTHYPGQVAEYPAVSSFRGTCLVDLFFPLACKIFLGPVYFRILTFFPKFSPHFNYSYSNQPPLPMCSVAMTFPLVHFGSTKSVAGDERTFYFTYLHTSSAIIQLSFAERMYGRPPNQ